MPPRTACGRESGGLSAGRVPGRAPQENPHEQHGRTAEPGDQAAQARDRRLPRRRQRVDAHMYPHLLRHRERMVDLPLPRHVSVRWQPRGSELIIAPWTGMIQSAQPFGHYPLLIQEVTEVD